MKKYYINIRNDKRSLLYALRTALAIYMTAILVWCWLVHPLTGIMCTALCAFCLIVSFNSTICDFTNYFTYNPETNEITLKRYRQRDRVINLSSVEKIVEKINELLKELRKEKIKVKENIESGTFKNIELISIEYPYIIGR